MLDALRTGGRFAALDARAADKRARLAAAPEPVFREAALAPLLAGLCARAGVAVDGDDPDAVARSLGLDDRRALHRLLAREEAYRAAGGSDDAPPPARPSRRPHDPHPALPPPDAAPRPERLRAHLPAVSPRRRPPASRPSASRPASTRSAPARATGASTPSTPPTSRPTAPAGARRDRAAMGGRTRPGARPVPTATSTATPRRPGFRQVHLYGCVRFALDVWEDYLGHPIPWHFGRDFGRLELVALHGWDNAHMGYGYLEVGDRGSRTAPSPTTA